MTDLAKTVGAVERLTDAVLLAETFEAAGTVPDAYSRAVGAVIAEADEWVDGISAQLVVAMTLATGMAPTDPVLLAGCGAAAHVCGAVIADEFTAAVGLTRVLAQAVAALTGRSVAGVLREQLDALRKVVDHG